MIQVHLLKPAEVPRQDAVQFQFRRLPRGKSNVVKRMGAACRFVNACANGVCVAATTRSVSPAMTAMAKHLPSYSALPEFVWVKAEQASRWAA